MPRWITPITSLRAVEPSQFATRVERKLLHFSRNKLIKVAVTSVIKRYKQNSRKRFKKKKNIPLDVGVKIRARVYEVMCMNLLLVNNVMRWLWLLLDCYFLPIVCNLHRNIRTIRPSYFTCVSDMRTCKFIHTYKHAHIQEYLFSTCYYITIWDLLRFGDHFFLLSAKFRSRCTL